MSAGVLAALLSIFLVVDFVDRARGYVGPGWALWVAELYGYKALVALHQLAPAALMLAAGATVSILQRRGELTVMPALGAGPAQALLPIGLGAALWCGGLLWFGEHVVVDAGRRVNEISVARFQRWTAEGIYFAPQRWFRGGDFIFYVRTGEVETGFQDVTVLRMTPGFELAERIDAKGMTYAGGTRWALSSVVDRTFEKGAQTQVVEAEHQARDLKLTDQPFRIRLGAPEQMKRPQLLQQIRARRAAGLSTVLYALALHGRASYSFAGLPAALLAAALALKAGRKWSLTAALAESLGIALVLWTAIVIARTLALVHTLSPPFASWAPVGAVGLAAAAAWLHREGRLLLKVS